MAREKKTTQNPFEGKEEVLAKLGKQARIDITKLEYNDGQLVGISKNPRYLKEAEHDTLKKSLVDSPELLEYKPLMVYPLENGSYITICGNMRLRIANELRLDGHSEFDTVPCFILKEGTPIQKIKEYAIKDNVQAGNWDWNELANGDWEVDELSDWGVDTTFLGSDDDSTDVDALFEDAQNTEQKSKEIKLSVYIPEELEDKVDEIMEAINSAITGYEGVELK